MTSDLFSLAGKIILVTGASRGLGRAMAAAMAEAGGHVVLNGRDQAALGAAAASIRDAGGAVEITAFDVTDEVAVNSAIAAIVGRHGRLDVAVGNAGIQHRRPLLDFATEMNTALIDNPEFSEFVGKRTPLGRWGRNEEIGGVAVFLASASSSYVNGHALFVDGGLTAAM